MKYRISGIQSSYKVINPSVGDKFLWREAVVITVILIMQLLGAPAAIFSFCALCIWAFRGPKNAIQALCLTWFLTYLTPGIFPKFEGTGFLHWVAFIAVFIAVFFRVIIFKTSIIRRISSEILCLALFCFYVAVVSIFKSYAPDVSLFKMVTFAMGVVTILFAFELSRDQKGYWQSWLTTFFLLILILGFPLIFCRLGYIKNGRGFQGLLNHPQSYGVFLAPMVAWFTGRLFFEKERSVPVFLGVLIGWISLYFSQARTGMLAIVFGCGLTIIIGLVSKLEWRRSFVRIISTKSYIAGFCILLILIMMNFSLVAKFTKAYMQKNEGGDDLIGAYQASRGGLIEKSLDNFKDHPWTGIGFGLPSDPLHLYVQRDSVLGLPIGAPIEKGFMPSAVLEEIGSIGAGLLLIFIFVLIRPVYKGGDLVSFWLFLTCLLVNLGEMDFFTFGGMGLYLWIIFGFSRLQTGIKRKN